MTGSISSQCFSNKKKEGEGAADEIVCVAAVEFEASVILLIVLVPAR
jgi:hypothetical protein